MGEVARLREVLAQYYGAGGPATEPSHRQQLEAELVRGRDDPASVLLAWEALHEPAAAGELLLWFAALVLDQLVLARWDLLAATAQLETLTSLRDLLAQRSSLWPRAVQLKLAQVYVRAGRQLWPERAPGFLDDVLAFVRSDAHRPLGLRLVDNLLAECGEPSRRTMLSARRRALARPLAVHAPALFAHVTGALEGAPDDASATEALGALVTCAQALPVSAGTLPPALVPAVCARLTSGEHAVRFGALSCLRTLFERPVAGADAAALFPCTLAPLEAALRAAPPFKQSADCDEADAERGALCETAHALCAHVLPRIGTAASGSCAGEVGALLAALLALTAAGRTRRAVRDAYGVWAGLLEGLSAICADGGERATLFGLPRAQFASEFGPGFGALLAELLRRREAAAALAVDALVPVGAPCDDGCDDGDGDGDEGAAFVDDDKEFAAARGFGGSAEDPGYSAGEPGDEDDDDGDEAGGVDTEDEESDDEEDTSGVRGVPSRAEAEIVSGLLALWPASAVSLLVERTHALCAAIAAAPHGEAVLGALGALAPHACHAVASLVAGTADGSAAAGHCVRAAVGALAVLSPPPPPAAAHARAATAARAGLLQLLAALLHPLAAARREGPGALADACALGAQAAAAAASALRDCAGGQMAGASVLARAATALTRALARSLPAELWLPAEGGADATDAAGRAAMAELLRDGLRLLPRLPPRARARLAHALALALLRPPRGGSSAAAYGAPAAVAAWRAEALAQLVAACARPWAACGLQQAGDSGALAAAAHAHDGRTGGWVLARATAASARALAAVACAADGAARSASDAALAALGGWLPTAQALLAHYGGAEAAGGAASAAAAEAAEMARLSALGGLSAFALALARGMRAQLAADGSLDALLDALVGLAAAGRSVDRQPTVAAARDGPVEALLVRLLAQVGGSQRHWFPALQLCAERLCGASSERGDTVARYHAVLDALVRERWRALQADDRAVAALVRAYAAALGDPWDRAGFRSGLARLPRADVATGGLLFAHRAFAEARPALAAGLVRVAIEPLHSAVRDDAIGGLHALFVLPPGGLAPLALVDEALAACASLDALQREQLRAAYAHDYRDACDLPSFRLMMASLADDLLVLGTVQLDRATLHAV
ncbi:hypothetical protein T492DRAFT_1150295 [Pavlovales sp. CCMP2436]|nr:hypothetical protein T492DRAFT_1150295 [Pavlovales sp. CCMP2436]